MVISRVATLTALTALLLTGASGPATAAPETTSPAADSGRSSQLTRPAPDSLRALAQRAGLRIGTAVDVPTLTNDATYRQFVGDQFSSVTPENVMKWQLIEPERGQYDWAPADELVAFARRHGQTVHGHTLVWHGQLPTWLTSGTFTNEELRAILRDHIRTEVRHFKGKVRAWDVVNEAFNEDGTLRDTIFLRQLGPGYLADAFRWAHQADPSAKLFYNDYNIEGINPKSDAVYALVRQLRRDGVPIHGVGVQGHLGVQYPVPTTVRENLTRFSRLGLETAVTEADVRMIMPPDPAKLAASAHGFNVLLQGCLLTPRCKTFTVWGFTDKYSWIPGWSNGVEGAATLLDENFQPKPAYRAVRDTLALAAR